MRFLGDLASVAFAVESVAPPDWLRVAEFVAAYQDLPLGPVDASVVTLCERRGLTDVATFDLRDFTVVRARHAKFLNSVN